MTRTTSNATAVWQTSDDDALRKAPERFDMMHPAATMSVMESSPSSLAKAGEPAACHRYVTSGAFRAGACLGAKSKGRWREPVYSPATVSAWQPLRPRSPQTDWESVEV